MKCPICQNEMNENCYLQDKAQSLSDFVLIKKDNNYKKTTYPLHAALCEKCGHVELFVNQKHLTK